MVVANIIHLRLKTEEKAIISIEDLLFSWRVLPMILDMVMKTKIIIFVW